MIGTFLVFVAAVCALFRCWWDRLEYYLYKTEIGQSLEIILTTRTGLRRFWFVQYFIRGREFWWWTPTAGKCLAEIDEAAAELLDQSLPKRRGHKVQDACLFTVGDAVDVTEFLRQLSGPGGDFYWSRVPQPPLDADTVKAYLTVRMPAKDTDWLSVTMRVVPGSVAPFKPLKFDLCKKEA